MEKKTLYSKIYEEGALFKAFDTVYKNGVASRSRNTRNSVKAFKSQQYEHLSRLKNKLHAKDFRFTGKGHFTKKKDGELRSLIVAPVQSRIVQRSILNVLEEIPQIKNFVVTATSFGSIKKRGVKDAIEAVLQAIKEKKVAFYFRSDIKSFFTKIPRKKVIQQISPVIEDEEFVKILDSATNFEIENKEFLSKKLGKEFAKNFLFNEIGVPQGCAISAILANIYLYEFDLKMNQENIVCLRYLDDFIILAESKVELVKAIKKMKELLSSLGLECYDPRKDPQKAAEGSLSRKFDFLGIEFHQGGRLRRPSEASCKKLLNEVRETFQKSLSCDFSKAQKEQKEEFSIAKTLKKINNKIKGWRAQYAFCNDKAKMISLDKKINQEIVHYKRRIKMTEKNLEDAQKRRRLGICLLGDLV